MFKRVGILAFVLSSAMAFLQPTTASAQDRYDGDRGGARYGYNGGGNRWNDDRHGDNWRDNDRRDWDRHDRDWRSDRRHDERWERANRYERERNYYDRGRNTFFFEWAPGREYRRGPECER